jgi:methylthioribose-1-phosphate isomerase
MINLIVWTGSVVRLLDQTRLPLEKVYVDIVDEEQMHDAIRRMVVQGAPAIRTAAAFGTYLGVRGHVDDSPGVFFPRLQSVCEYLATSRPTNVDLARGLERIQSVAKEVAGSHVSASPVCQVVRDVIDAILDECLKMIAEDHDLPADGGGGAAADPL